MEFPKQVMTVTELTHMGFDRKYLNALTRLPNQDFCWKKNPLGVSSTFLFDTSKLQKFIDRQINIQTKKSHAQ